MRRVCLRKQDWQERTKEVREGRRECWGQRHPRDLARTGRCTQDRIISEGLWVEWEDPQNSAATLQQLSPYQCQMQLSYTRAASCEEAPWEKQSPGSSGNVSLSWPHREVARRHGRNKYPKLPSFPLVPHPLEASGWLLCPFVPASGAERSGGQVWTVVPWGKR